MARSKNNIATHGLSGQVDQFVFRNWFGRTVVAKLSARKERELSEEEKETRLKFKAASHYAKGAVKNAALKLFYKSKADPGQSAYNMAFADYFTGPEIGEIDSSKYDGSSGSAIRVPVSEDFKVASVNVKIEKPDGTLVEEGEAVIMDDELHWEYIASVDNLPLNGGKIIVTAMDLPANVTIKEKTL